MTTAKPSRRIFLDDVRQEPPDWERAYWPDEVIAALKAGNAAKISLDHDLGDDVRGTGYDVIRWIEEAVALHHFVPPKIHVHSANPVARARMLAGIESITRLIDDVKR